MSSENTSENTIDNEGWTTIVKKKRIITNFNPESKPTKYIYKWTGEVTKKDTTLTTKEQELLLHPTHPTLRIYCTCCQSDMISDLICRTFFRCNRCYCCVGDNPAYDDDEWFENCITSVGIFYKYNKDYHFTKDKDFYENR